MRRFAVVVIGLMALALGGPASAAGSAWNSKCETDAMTNKKSCTAGTVIQISEDEGGGFILLDASPRYDGPVVSIFGHRNLCPRGTSMIRIDKNKARSFEWFEGAGFISRDDARGLVKEMEGGRTALVRAVMWPRCTPRDFSVPLEGFSAAWREAVAGAAPSD